MVTQAIKAWLQKVFAWWPWKQSSPIEYQHIPSVASQRATNKRARWGEAEDTVPHTSATPGRFALENRTERVVQSLSEVPDMPSLSTLSPVGTEPVGNAASDISPAPTQRKRLEFLRYLVQRGIVNEGFESNEPDSI